MGVVTPALAKAMVGSRKPVGLPPGLDPDTAVDTFIERPEFFMSGPSVEVTPDAKRRPITRSEFVEALYASGPHGFTDQNRREGTAYYVHDTPAVRFITLDTVCAAGDADGSIDAPQLHWLERRLEEAHSSFRSRDGSTVSTRHRDRLVVIHDGAVLVAVEIIGPAAIVEGLGQLRIERDRLAEIPDRPLVVVLARVSEAALQEGIGIPGIELDRLV